MLLRTFCIMKDNLTSLTAYMSLNHLKDHSISKTSQSDRDHNFDLPVRGCVARCG